MKNILLAGATGFLGNKILQELGKEDFKITAVSRTKIKNLPENAQEQIIDFDCLNLYFETFDGLIKHNGPFKDLSKLENIIGIKSLKNKFKLNKFSCLESQISNIADDIAYNNHDIQDGLKAGLFTLEELLEINFFKDIYKKYKNKKKIELQVLIHQIIRDSIDPVSYTHLTLPTIYSV